VERENSERSVILKNIKQTLKAERKVERKTHMKSKRKDSFQEGIEWRTGREKESFVSL